MEWSALLLLFYVPIVLITQRKRASRILKRWTWLTMAYVPFVSISALMYGFWYASRNWSSTGSIDIELTVPTHDPIYMALTVFSVACAILPAALISKNSFVNSASPPESNAA